MKSDLKQKAPPVPCGSCPYRKDVPSGIWAKNEYDKLPSYDGETWEQSPAIFMCHQRDGTLCGGWLACHNPRELLALRFHQHSIDPSVFDYTTDVPVFESGAAARAHGIKDIKRPKVKARKMVAGLVKRQEMISDSFGNFGSKRKRKLPKSPAKTRELFTAGQKGTLANRRKRIKVTLSPTGKDKP